MLRPFALLQIKDDYVIFQQDSAHVAFANSVRDFLDKLFPQQ